MCIHLKSIKCILIYCENDVKTNQEKGKGKIILFFNKKKKKQKIQLLLCCFKQQQKAAVATTTTTTIQEVSFPLQYVENRKHTS